MNDVVSVQVVYAGSGLIEKLSRHTLFNPSVCYIIVEQLSIRDHLQYQGCLELVESNDIEQEKE